MSDLDDFLTSSQADAMEVIGTMSVTIDGTTYPAVVNQFSAERELELGGFVGTYDASAFIELSELSALTAPLERTLEGKTLTVDGRTLRIDRVLVDVTGVTLALSNPAKRKK